VHLIINIVLISFMGLALKLQKPVSFSNKKYNLTKITSIETRR
jgi:hypothetical protein